MVSIKSEKIEVPNVFRGDLSSYDNVAVADARRNAAGVPKVTISFA